MFLWRLYKDWRPMYWVVLLFGAAQVFFMVKGIENVPFFLYNMYSRDHRPQDSVAVYLLKTPYGYLNHKSLSNREEELLMNSAAYYLALKQQGDGTSQAVEKRFRGRLPEDAYDLLYGRLVNLPSALAKYPEWWSRYLHAVTGDPNLPVQLVKAWVYAQPPYRLSNTDSFIFRSLPAQ